MADLRKLGHELLREQHTDFEERFNDIDYLLGKHILTQMIKKGLTQQQLADICEVPLKTIHRVQGGNKETSVETYKTILKKLGSPNVDKFDLSDTFSEKCSLYISLHDPEFISVLDETLDDYEEALKNLDDNEIEKNKEIDFGKPEGKEVW